ncbi:hypothetical protein Tco_0969001 [Tanacetum coccineum]
MEWMSRGTVRVIQSRRRVVMIQICLKARKLKSLSDRNKGNSFKLLADSVNKFSKIYSRIENSKIYQMIDVEKMRMDFQRYVEIQRISLTGFPAQSVGSSNTDVLDSPCLLVLITGMSQSRQHVITSLIHIESCKSPTKSLFDVGSSRISIFTVNT